MKPDKSHFTITFYDTMRVGTTSPAVNRVRILLKYMLRTLGFRDVVVHLPDSVLTNNSTSAPPGE